MNLSSRMAAVIATVLALAGTTQAQIGGGVNARHHRHHQRVVGFNVQTIVPYGVFGYGAGLYGFGYNPLYGVGPAWGYGWGGLPLFPTPVPVVPATSPPVVIQNIVQVPPAGAGAGVGGFVAPEFAPAAKPGVKPMPKPRVAVPPKPVVPVVPPPKQAQPPVGQAGADRIVEAGRRAFTDGQYGRARELFRRAVEFMPTEPSTHYLVSQADFALGKYRQAVDAIASGMSLQPNWPDTRFNSRDLYWHDPKLFEDHLQSLRQALADFPNDAALSFLLGHQLWFDGKKDEARLLFQKAAALAKGETPAEAFLAK